MRERVQEGGFTYLLLLWWVALAGVMLMALGESWSMQARREREAELVYRGEQIRAAIEAYASVPVGEGVSRLPDKLEDLLEDRRSGPLRRHLRQLWRDPITRGGTWGLVRDAGGIAGVHSLSRQVPLLPPAGVERYDQWRFVAEVQAPPQGPAASGAEPSVSPSPLLTPTTSP